MADAETGFDYEAACTAARETADYGAKIDLLLEAVGHADGDGDAFWGIYLRDELAHAFMDTDPPRTLPVAAEMVALYEDHPEERADWMEEAILVDMAYATVNAAAVSGIPSAQLEDLAAHYLRYAERFGQGMQTHWFVQAMLHAKTDLPRAIACIERALDGAFDIGYPDCVACACANAVGFYLEAGDVVRAADLARAVAEGRVETCSQAMPHLIDRLLDHALDAGDLEAARVLAEEMGKTAIEYPSASLMRYLAYDDRSSGLGYVEVVFSEEGLLDEHISYVYHKAAWAICHETSKRGANIGFNHAERFPERFPKPQPDGTYDAAELAGFFWDGASRIAAAFDARNGTAWYARDLQTCRRSGEELSRRAQERRPGRAAGGAALRMLGRAGLLALRRRAR